jgi:hypothetical protein
MSHNVTNMLYGTAGLDNTIVLADGANVAINGSASDSFVLVGGALGTRQLDNPSGGFVAQQRRIIVLEFIFATAEELTFDTLYDFGDPGAPPAPAGAGRLFVTMFWNGSRFLCSYVPGYSFV